MNSPRRRAREMALKALYQSEMMKDDSELALNAVLAETFYQPIFDAIAREFLKNSKSEQVLAGEVENFVPDFSVQLSATPSSKLINETEGIVKQILEKNFPGLTYNEKAKNELEAFYKKTEEKRKKNFPVEEFSRELVKCATENHKRINDILKKTALNWSLERMAIVDRCILRIAACELFYFEAIPINASINEAIELAKKYSADKSYEFVNGILDRICKENKMSKIIIASSSNPSKRTEKNANTHVS